MLPQVIVSDRTLLHYVSLSHVLSVTHTHTQTINLNA